MPISLYHDLPANVKRKAEIQSYIPETARYLPSQSPTPRRLPNFDTISGQVFMSYAGCYGATPQNVEPHSAWS